MSKGSTTVKVAWIGFAGLVLAAVITGVFALWPKKEAAGQTNRVEQSDSERSVVFQGHQTGNAISIDQSTKESQIGSVGVNDGVIITGDRLEQNLSITNAVKKGEAKP